MGLSMERHSDGTFRVSSSEADLTTSIWNAAKSTGTPVQSITPAKNDLETIFVKAVEEAQIASL